MQEVKLGTPISETFSLRSIIGERLLLSQWTLRNNTYLLRYTAEFGFMGLDSFVNLPYCDIQLFEVAGTYSIKINTGHIDFVAGIYQVYILTESVPELDDIDYFFGPWNVVAAPVALDLTPLMEFTVGDYTYDALNRPTSAVKTYADGTIVDITITYSSFGKSSYKETIRA